MEKEMTGSEMVKIIEREQRLDLFGKIMGILLTWLVYCIAIYFLWNWLMPDLFGVSKITFLQSIGIQILTDVLFKSNHRFLRKE